MEILNISKSKFASLTSMEIPKEVTNTEAQMFLMDTHKGLKVVKKLHILNGEKFANKLYTLEMLNEMRDCLPNNLIIPDALLAVNGNIMGFTMPYVYGTNLSSILNNRKIDPKQCIYYLKQIGYILEQLQKIRTNSPLKDFYINDLHEGNIIVNKYNEGISIIDLDSCKIGTNDTSEAKYTTDYSLASKLDYKYKKNTEGGRGYLKADQNTDMYCYVITILNYLFGENINNWTIEDYFNYLDYLNYLGYNSELLETFRKITYNCENDNPVGYLDTISPEQVYRANKKIYQLNRNK